MDSYLAHVGTMVTHPDGTRIRKAQIWMEPMAANDIVTFTGLATPAVVASMDAMTRVWTIQGLASASDYTEALRHWLAQGPLHVGHTETPSSFSFHTALGIYNHCAL
eukprot:scaffold249803_cov22-Prasinocladus_malaysianus.AAC.1